MDSGDVRGGDVSGWGVISFLYLWPCHKQLNKNLFLLDKYKNDNNNNDDDDNNIIMTTMMMIIIMMMMIMVIIIIIIIC